MADRRKSFAVFTHSMPILLLLVFGTPAAAQNQMIPPAISVLPQNAKDDFDRGVAAAKQQAWNLAIRYFTEAHMKAPAYAPLLFNLSLVHGQAGHDAIAAAWLRAYLAAAPDAANSAAAREKLVQLNISTEQKIIKILETARHSAQNLADEFPRKAALLSVSLRYADLGDIKTAVALLPERETEIWLEYANAMIEQRDVDHAMTAIAKLAEGDRDRYRLRLISLLEQTGDKARLEQVQNGIRDPDYIAKLAFDRALAQNNISDANAALTKVQNVAMKNEMTFDLVQYHITKGNLVAAREATQKQQQPLLQIAIAHLKEGNIAAAQAVAKEAKQVSTVPSITISAILNDQEDFKETNGIIYNIERLIYIQALKGKLDAARRTDEAAERNLKEAKLSEWNRYAVGSTAISEAIAERVLSLSAQGKYIDAKKLASELARVQCNRSAEAFIAIARLALTQNRSDDIASILNGIPTASNEVRLQDDCAVARAMILVDLASSYRSANRAQDAKKIIAEVADLVWRGALDRRVVESVAGLQIQFGDEAAAAVTRSAGRYISLPRQVSLARYIAAMRSTTNLIEEIEQVTGDANKNHRNPSDVINVPAKLASVAGELIWAFQMNRQRGNATDIAIQAPDRLASWDALKRGNDWSNQQIIAQENSEYRKALRLDPQNASAFFERATNSYLNQKSFDRALSDYSAAIRLEPGYAGAYNNRGAIWAGFGQYDIAINDFTQAIRADPSLPDAYKNRATALKLRNELDRAITDLNEAIRLNPKYSDAYVELCNVYIRKNDLDRATQNCEQAIRIEPNNANAYTSRGAIFHRKTQFDRAIQDYDQAIRINPKFTRAYYNRAEAWLAKGPAYNSRAIADYQKTIELGPFDLDPNNNFAKQNLARLGAAIPSARSAPSENSRKSEIPPPPAPSQQENKASSCSRKIAGSWDVSTAVTFPATLVMPQHGGWKWELKPDGPEGGEAIWKDGSERKRYRCQGNTYTIEDFFGITLRLSPDGRRLEGECSDLVSSVGGGCRIHAVRRSG